MFSRPSGNLSFELRISQNYMCKGGLILLVLCDFHCLCIGVLRRFMQRPIQLSIGWVDPLWTGRNISGQAVVDG